MRGENWKKLTYYGKRTHPEFPPPNLISEYGPAHCIKGERMWGTAWLMNRRKFWSIPFYSSSCIQRAGWPCCSTQWVLLQYTGGKHHQLNALGVLVKVLIYLLIWTWGLMLRSRHIDLYVDTVCPGSSDPFYIVTYYIKWVTTSWTHSTNFTNLLKNNCCNKSVKWKWKHMMIPYVQEVVTHFI